MRVNWWTRLPPLDDGEIVYLHFSRNLRGVTDDDVVFQHTVVGDVRIGHDEAVTPDDRLPFGGRPPVDRDAFTQGRVVPDDDDCFFSFEFQVLRNAGDNSSGEYLAIVPDTCSVQDDGVRVNMAIVTNDDIFFDDGEWLDRDVFAQLGFRVYDC